MKNIHDSWEEVERSTVTGVQRKGIQLSWMIEGLRTSAEDVPADVVRTAGFLSRLLHKCLSGTFDAQLSHSWEVVKVPGS